MRRGFKARPHDVAEVIKLGAEVIELHASSEDLEKKIEGKYDVPLVVHLPEYNGTDLLDASATDETRRLQASTFYQKAINVAREWGASFKGTPKAIIHPGGWSPDGFVKKVDARSMYESFFTTVRELNLNDIELMVENMPPFPWFYGGQWYSNIFMNPNECRDYTIGNGIGFCFDVCHAFLFCKHVKEIDMVKFMQTVRPCVGHIHFSDAKGIDGEGLQVGEGEMDLKAIFEYLGKLSITFVPEVWQGHKDGYAGFKTAWERVDEFKN